MKTNFYGFLIALLLNASLAIAYTGVSPFASADSTASLTTPKVSVDDFQCSSTDARTQLTWSVKNNEMTDQLVLERSVDGAAFKTLAIIFPTEEKGSSEYAYRDRNMGANTMYRIKITEKNGKTNFSTLISR